MCEGKNIIIMQGKGGTAYGTDGDDCIFGTSGKDTIKAKAGNDVVVAGKGKDVVYGGAGDVRASYALQIFILGEKEAQ